MHSKVVGHYFTLDISVKCWPTNFNVISKIKIDYNNFFSAVILN